MTVTNQEIRTARSTRSRKEFETTIAYILQACGNPDGPESAGYKLVKAQKYFGDAWNIVKDLPFDDEEFFAFCEVCIRAPYTPGVTARQLLADAIGRLSKAVCVTPKPDILPLPTASVVGNVIRVPFGSNNAKADRTDQ